MNTQAVVDRIKLLDRRFLAMDEAIRRFNGDPNRVNLKRAQYYAARYHELVKAFDPAALGIEV